MRRRSFITGVAAAVAAGCGRRTQRLNVYNWSDYIGGETIPKFEREFNVEVRYGTYEVAEEMFAKVMTGNSGWDIVFPSNSYVVPMRQMDLLAKLDHRLLPNLVNLDDRFRSPFGTTDLNGPSPTCMGQPASCIRRMRLLPPGGRICGPIDTAAARRCWTIRRKSLAHA